MSDLLEYLDNVSIDVVKRKYYNANKVNAVLEEIRTQADALLRENERLRAALEAQGREEQQTKQSLDALQAAYREALRSAHARADAMLDTAQEESGKLMRKAEHRAENAARQVEECLNAVRVREEQNVEFLNARLRQFLSDLYEDENPAASPAVPEDRADADVWTALKSFPATAANGSPEQELRTRVSALSSEISALEDGR